jgi:hypothetical protein
LVIKTLDPEPDRYSAYNAGSGSNECGSATLLLNITLHYLRQNWSYSSSLDLCYLQEELDVFMESEDANYDRFSDCLAARRRQAAEQAAPPPAKSIGKFFQSVDEIM